MSVRCVHRLPLNVNLRSRLLLELKYSAHLPRRSIHTSRPWAAVRPFLLSDPGEGIKEVQIIQWFVQPGARVEEFDKICEVASDKANIEITSRFAGVIKKLHHDQDTVVQVGQALVDIDVQSEVSPEDEALLAPEESEAAKQSEHRATRQVSPATANEATQASPLETGPTKPKRSERLATPAVRGLLKSFDVNITEVAGSGKDGRVLKEDVHTYLAANRKAASLNPRDKHATQTPNGPSAAQDGSNTERSVPLTPIQAQMFKTMTRSLSIPHFLYADEVDFTPLSNLRRRLNTANSPPPANPTTPRPKLTYLPFIIKAVSLSLTHFPLLNARVDTSSPSSPPHLIYRPHHNIGIAIATPSGLLVPNIKNVAALSISQISAEIARLQTLANPSPHDADNASGLGSSGSSRLTPHDLSGGTFTVSNIGSIGGTYVAPVIVPTEVGILGVGRVRSVPGFAARERRAGGGGAAAGADKGGNVVSGSVDEDAQPELRLVEKTIANLSWSGDHRVVDGATLARMAEMVRGFLEAPERLVGYL